MRFDVGGYGGYQAIKVEMHDGQRVYVGASESRKDGQAGRILAASGSGLVLAESAFPHRARVADLPAKSQRVDEQLLRAIGVLGLTANIVNTTVGASIFKLPADMSKQLGAAAPLAFVVCAIAMALFVTSFALAGSRVSLTGGLYAYAELAFGQYVGFITGLFYYTTAVLSVAAVVNFFAGTVVALIPALGRTYRALRDSPPDLRRTGGDQHPRRARRHRAPSGSMTIAKLVPLLILVAVGIFFVHPANLAWPGWPDTATRSAIRSCFCSSLFSGSRSPSSRVAK